MGNGKPTTGRRWRTECHSVAPTWKSLWVKIHAPVVTLPTPTEILFHLLRYWTRSAQRAEWNAWRAVKPIEATVVHDGWAILRHNQDISRQAAWVPSGKDSLWTHRKLDDWALRDGYGGMQLMTPKIPNKGCSKTGFGRNWRKRITAQSPLQRPDFTSKIQASRVAEQLRCTECEKVNVRFYCRCSFLG